MTPTVFAAPPEAAQWTQAVIVQAKGQVTIPKAARDQMAIQPGDEVIWVRNEHDRWELCTVGMLDDELDAAFEGLDDLVADIKRNWKPGIPG